MSGGRGRAGPAGARRLARALLAMALVGAAAAAAGGAGRLAGSGVLQEAAAFASQRTSGKGAQGPEIELPEGFEEEAVVVSGRDEARSDAHAGLVGFTAEGSAEDAFSGIEEELRAKGWRSVESGVPSCGTFVKESGRHRWLFVSCVQAGESSSVVVQCGALARERG